MDIARLSGLKFYSLGIVVKNKEFGSDEAYITPVEEFSFENGPIVEDTRDFASSKTDISGVAFKAKAKGSAILKAKWIPDGNDHQDTAPDVRKNEGVKIYRFADTDEYWWCTLFREPELRRLEHVRYAFSNKPDGLDAYDAESSYWLEYSTKEKRVKLHTSDNDGEACTYDITINTKEGTVRLEDNLGNLIELDSPAGSLHTKTNSEVLVKTPYYHVKADVIVLEGTTYTKMLLVEDKVQAKAHPTPGIPTPPMPWDGS